MQGKLSLGQYLIWLILLLRQLHICKSCIGKERKALLELKNYIISKTDDQLLIDGVLPTWTNDTKNDCCRWEGVECNRTNNRVFRLSVVYMNTNKRFLFNLSLLHPFEEVRSLNLSKQYAFNGFFDDVEGYKSLGRLRNLEILDLSSNEFKQRIFPFINAATSLKTLFLQNNYMNGSFPFKELKDLKNLELLDLRGNMFDGSMHELTHLKKLKALDLSSIYFPSTIELMQVLKNLTNLEVLNVAQSNLDGPIPKEVVCEMKNMRELNLRGNHFVGQIPHCLGILNKLRVLDLSSNQLSGDLPFSFNSFESLEYLSLSDNNFTGLFSLCPLTNLTKLKVLKLSSLSDMVQVETVSTWPPKFQLSVVELRSCSLEIMPTFLMNQKNLRLVDLSSNRLTGSIPTWLLANNLKLEVLQLQDNSFTIFEMPTRVHNLRFLDFSANNIHGPFPNNIGRVLPNLILMNGSNNGFKGNFPSSISEIKNITFLDLSYNNFFGELPKSFVTGCISLTHLELSHNKFSGHFLPNGTSFTSLNVLRMDNNLFSGEIGVGLRSFDTLFTLDLSNNRLTGTIPSWIFKLYYVYFLLLANNLFEGTIPSSLLGMPFLSLLDLSGNQIYGPLPSRVNGVWGTYLALHDNNFTGEIPNTLLEKVKILDLRNNKLSGSIPQFVNTQDIAILLLRGNNLTGSIPKQLCDLRNIRLLDLSDNKLTGFIPSCLFNMSFGLGEEDPLAIWIPPDTPFPSPELEYYKPTFVVEKLEAEFPRYFEIEIRFATKQRYDSYGGRTSFSEGILYYMYGMDLSNNKLSGDIPTELGDLSKLRVLNLSRNFLSSFIPPSFSNLTDIESLDLSYNMLRGSIPQQLTSLTSLVVFDVSYNNLSGIIPQGRQFNTFTETYYSGNPLLCGPPTNVSCEDNKSSEEEDHRIEDETSEAPIDMLVFYLSTASTYVIALASILVILSIDCPLRRGWFYIADSFIAFAKSMFP